MRHKSTVKIGKKEEQEEKKENEMNKDPCILGYKLVTRTIGAPQSTDQIDRILRALLPRNLLRVDVNGAEYVENCPLLTMRDLEEAVLTMRNKKAPDPDGILAEVCKLVFRQ